MNFSPFSGFSPALSGSPMQISGGKLTNGIPAGGQVLGMIGPDQVHYLGGAQAPQLITLPITVSGKAEGDQQFGVQPQTIQIQVVNPGMGASPAAGAKFVMPIQIQGFPQGAATVLTLAYNQTGTGEPLQLQLAPQPQCGESNNNEEMEAKDDSEDYIDSKGTQTFKEEKGEQSEEDDVNADPEDSRLWDDCIGGGSGSGAEDKLPNNMPLSLHHFLRFSADTIRREQALQESPTSDPMSLPEEEPSVDGDPKAKKRKRSGKKKPPRPRKPRPGQVHIATALDGTTLFCCPECHMAYPEKEQLEQHLVGHKIERRFICDTCGAGLKRKEHLERHKLGHNPERPFICPVCTKGFKRKEHLNLHSVIHSGSKSEVCQECGKGFYRKDHLRKHAKSHMTKKMKEAAQIQAQTILEAHQQLAQVSVTLPNMPGLSVIPLGPAEPIEEPEISMVPVKTELDEEDLMDDDMDEDLDDGEDHALPDVSDDVN